MTSTPPIRVLVVDDEPLAREGVRQLIEGQSGFVVVGECADGDTAVAGILEARPDVVFLDIQMPGRDGFDVLRSIPETLFPLVVFVTAHDDFALRAFDAHAIDYVVKPVDRGRFQETLDRVRERHSERQVAAMTKKLLSLLGQEDLQQRSAGAGSPLHLERVSVKTGDRVYFVETADIDWIEAADYYAALHTGKQSHLVRMSLNALEEKLDPAQFTRIHRSTIVNIARVKELRRQFHGNQIVILKDGTRLKLSKSYHAAFRAALGQTD